VDAVHVELGYQSRDGLLTLNRFRDNADGTSTLAVRAEMGYAATHELTSLRYSTAAGVTIADYSYTFNDAGQLTAETTNGQGTAFSYDLRGNLTKTDHTARPDETFAWDANGNAAAATVAADNRLVSDGTVRLIVNAQFNLALPHSWWRGITPLG
jgi:YD repeat-containing protein